MTIWEEFHGPNAGFVLELYERYQQDPSGVDPKTRAYFEQSGPPPADFDAPAGSTPASTPIPSSPPAVSAPTPNQLKTAFVVANYAQAIRDYGHLAAQLDPLGDPPHNDPALDLAHYDATEADLAGLPADLVGGPVSEWATDAVQALRRLRDVYTTHTGYDFSHITDPAQRNWLREAAESGRFSTTNKPIDPLFLLKQLTQVEAFEHFLHRSFPGKTRFSIEGLDMMVPMLNTMIIDAGLFSIHDILLGMAHRGRLNVMAHVLHKPYREILAEFKDPIGEDYAAAHENMGWTGDVKYHSGAFRRVNGESGREYELSVSMAPNPSHLEHVNPVALGMARAAGTKRSQAGAVDFNPLASVPILIHGDAAFPGQGVVAETLNMHSLPGYNVGGTLHIIANNQVGFTTNPNLSRSTLYASDMAKGFGIPVIHVNADDQHACIEAARIAFAYLAEFGNDFVIDLIGYRRYGHNEGDEPKFTQPVRYNSIGSHPTVRQQYAHKLAEQGLTTIEEADMMKEVELESLQEIFESLKPEHDMPEPTLENPEEGIAKRVKTGLSINQLRSFNDHLIDIPSAFNLNSKLKRGMKRRKSLFDNYDEATIDWATAESLAFASILADGTPIRLTGEDVQRGTFSHRHAVMSDQANDEYLTLLQTLPQAQAAFEIHNSPLSENAAIGFEYGYNIQAPESLVLWEAQYGDFVNGAQAMLDEFVVSGHAKWGQTPSLVILLPHGHEGQGPDHSTGRLERFLQSAAEINMRVVNCTTAAQYFHLLRRQASLLHSDPLPLIMMTPKGLLRHSLAMSAPRDFVEKNWQPIIDDPDMTDARRPDIKRVIACSGRVFVDLAQSDYRKQRTDIAIIRIEQLYPLPADLIGDMLDSYPNLEQVTWVQEEPRNMGAWTNLKPQFTRIRQIIGKDWGLNYVGRPRRASPAEGTSAWHNVNQKLLIQKAFEG